MGWDEAEFVALLAKHGMSLQDVQLVHQWYSVEPFLQDSYDLAQVTMYNEIHLVRKALGSGDDIQVISPKDYGVDILWDMIFTRDDVIAQRSGELVKFLEQSMRGWQYVIDHPEESLEIILSKYPDLEKTQQQTVMKAVIEMITKGNKPLGDIQVSDYARAQDILYASKQIDKKLDPHVFVNESLIKQIQR